MDDSILIVILAFVLLMSVSQYFEDRFCLACLTYGQKIISFIIGATVVALFTELLDSAYLSIHSTYSLFSLLIPISFVSFLFLYRHIFTHKDNQSRSKELSFTIKLISSFSDLLVGILAISQIKNDLFSEITFLGILLSYELLEQLSFHLIHEESTIKSRGFFRKIALSSWTLLGFLFAFFLDIPETINAALFAIYSGAVFSVIVREIFSHERKILPPYFLVGILSFSFLFVIKTII